MSESNKSSTKKNILNAVFNNKKMGIKVMYLDAILAKDNLTHIVNDNVMKIYYAYKHCYSQLSNEIVKDYPDEVQYTDPKWQDKIVKFILEKKESGHTSCLEQGSVTFVITGSRTCYSEDTEILTKRGWQYFYDLQKDDEFATRTHDGTLVWHKAYDFIEYERNDYMISFKVSGGIDLLVTPDHQMLSASYENKTYPYFKLMPAFKFLNGHIGSQKMTKEIVIDNKVDDTFVIPGLEYWVCNQKRFKDPLVFDRKIFFKFLAWYLSEGSVYYNANEHSYRIDITQYNKGEKNEANRKEIIFLLQQMGITPIVTQQGISFKNLVLGTWLTRLGISYEKVIPFDIFTEFNKELANEFIDTYSKADASIDSTGHIKLYTTSKALADQLQLLVFIGGKSANIWKDDRREQSHYSNVSKTNIRHNHICYVVSIRQQYADVHFNKYTKYVKKINNYSGKVYCVSVPNHTVFVRRNGIPIWCGNCSHQLVRTRVGVGIAQNSQRYTRVEQGSEIVPESMLKLFDKNSEIKDKYDTTITNVYNLYSQLIDLGIPKGDARFVLTQGVKTSIQMTFNFAALYRFFEMRLCQRAQFEIRNVAKMMATLMQIHYPGLFDNVGPRCQYLGWCPEHKGCGKYLPKKDVTVISNTLLKELTNVKQDITIIDKYKEIINQLQNDKEQLVKENSQYIETIKKLSFCIATGAPLDYEYRKNPIVKDTNK